ncbi:DUF4019 domain-containing protein [Desulfobacula toluolica]|uniref:Conserved uncharacterized protein n=1 Tax=Desulfobacula toluolica (strain DSM 7467 / Tol2) TaxID=651182 RepID=K0NAS9_DESTT|nr:DUF4019 domain-containing protein [Desulfobacula toluolica]CCK81269.1 conserved uncharacterized protein [Desulfobacula toluolica Tol2]
MKKRNLIVLSILISLVFFKVGFAQGTKGDDAENEDGIISAQNWMALVDNKNYFESWETAARIFKSSVSAHKWEKIVTKVRDPLGNLISRDLFHDQLTASLPGMPDGQYLILRYVSKFANKAKSVESVTVMIDTDGKWRVAGYFIK